MSFLATFSATPPLLPVVDEVERIFMVIRSRYLARFRASVESVRRRTGSVVVEPIGPAASRRQESKRADFTLLDQSWTTPVAVTSTTIERFAPYEFGSQGVSFLVRPFMFEACEIALEGTVQSLDLTPLGHWFDAWFDTANGGQSVDDRRWEFLGAVHFMSRPQWREHYAHLTIDFGSAPKDSLWGLVDALARTGARTIHIGGVRPDSCQGN